MNIVSGSKIVKVEGELGLKHGRRGCDREESEVVLLFVVKEDF